MSTHSIRPLTNLDQDFLWEIVYHAIHVPPGAQPPSRAIVNEPGIAKYVKEWGRHGDFGVIVIQGNTARAVGAAWLRLFPASDPGYGFVGENIPEISTALLPEHRNQGIGTTLLTYLIEHAETRYPAVSLSVVATNPALHLYTRLGFKAVATDGNSITAVLEF